MTPATLNAPVGRRAARGGACDEPPRLWDEDAVVAPVPTAIRQATSVAAEPVAPVAQATLADVVEDLWHRLSTAAGLVPCIVCGAAMEPKWSAGAGVVGGRCDGCGTIVEPA